MTLAAAAAATIRKISPPAEIKASSSNCIKSESVSSDSHPSTPPTTPIESQENNHNQLNQQARPTRSSTRSSSSTPTAVINNSNNTPSNVDNGDDLLDSRSRVIAGLCIERIRNGQSTSLLRMSKEEAKALYLNGSLRLVSIAKAAEIRSRANERKRRTTANPLYSGSRLSYAAGMVARRPSRPSIKTSITNAKKASIVNEVRFTIPTVSPPATNGSGGDELKNSDSMDLVIESVSKLPASMVEPLKTLNIKEQVNGTTV